MLDQPSPSQAADPVAVAVAEIFATLFEVDSVGIDEDFFRLGGDSLVAEALTDEIERRFGVGLSISALVEASTPRTIAAAVAAAEAEAKSSERNLLSIRPVGKGPALFCVHGMDGESFFPQQLSVALDEDRPLYGFRAFGLKPGERPLGRVEAMAEEYLVSVLSRQTKAPYLILGHCGAGTMVAWEMCQRLMSIGRAVAGCVLIDPASDEDFAPFLHKTGLALELERVKSVNFLSELAVWSAQNKQETGEKRRYMTKVGLTTAVRLYSPQPISCPVLLLYSKAREDVLFNARGYGKLAKDLETHAFEASHRELLKDRVEDIAGVVRSFLDRVAPIS